MGARTSRAYKLQLSDVGLGHFIDCHCRLARLAGDLIPYGVTLYAAMTVFAGLDSSEQVAELEAPLCSRLVGRSAHFVGFSPELRALIVHISESISASGQVARNPLVNRLYVAGLAAFASAEDAELRQAYGKATDVLATRVLLRRRVPPL